MRFDMHVHTSASPDSLSRPERLMAHAKRRGLDGLAITDHNTITMALQMSLWSDVRIIVGEEIYTQSGEVIGLFMRERVAPGQPVGGTIRQIHDQGGLVLLPHPYDSLRHSAIAPDALEALMGVVDIIEVFNARIIRPEQNELARDLAHRYHKPVSAGSDAHLVTEVGSAWVEVEDFDGPQSFLQVIGRAAVQGKSSSPLVHVGSTVARLFK